MSTLQSVTDALTTQFGPLDNTIGDWVSQTEGLQSHFPAINAALTASFSAPNAPLAIFEEARSLYEELCGEVQAVGSPAAEGYLNLRFYILLNGFLAGAKEAAHRIETGQLHDNAEAIQRSGFAPFFFDKAHLTTDEVREMLADDLAQLAALPPDKKGALAAMRIKKGIVSTLTESYCTRHPLLFPHVQALDRVENGYDQKMIYELVEKVSRILDQL